MSVNTSTRLAANERKVVAGRGVYQKILRLTAFAQDDR